MPQIINNNKNQYLTLFADDSNLKFSAKTLQELERNIAQKLALVNQFLKTNNLTLNIEKTKFVAFATKQNGNTDKPRVLYNTDLVEEVNTTNFLGLKIDKFLSWDDHVKHVISKVNSGIYALRQMRYLCNHQMLKSVYHAHVQSHIYFGISLYGST
ncbi:hypothetical protein J6590_108435 [Homalodisca vitripennis]|nr:hypothetical protein J6590_108435 [Homalodisca vitripennis]